MCALVAPAAYAADEQDIYNFKIPRMEASATIDKISQRFNTPVVFSFDKVKNIQANQLDGQYSIHQALDTALLDTGLQAQLTEQGVIIIFHTEAQNDPREDNVNLNKKTLVNGAASAAFALLSTAPVAAQTTSEENASNRLDVITVTARRVEESLKDTPIAVTVTTGDDLVKGDVSRITGITETAPNVNFSFAGTSSGSDSAAVVFIRGVGQNDFTVVSDPGVGIYVDGVFLGRTVGSALDIFDLKQVEVLRGPQGTVFGRNSVGGAINVTTADVTDEFEGRLRAVVGDDGRFEQFLTLNVPISDSFGIRASGFNRDRDGTVTRQDGVDLGDDNIFGGRLKAQWEPTDNFRSTFSFDYSQEDEESAAEVLLDSIEASPFVNFFNSNTFGNGSTDPACAGDGQGTPPDINNPACANDQFVLGEFDSAETGPSFNENEVWGVSLTNEFDISDNLTLKSITGYRDVDARFARASDGTPFDIFSTQTTYTQEQFSQEFQLIGSNFDNRFNWVGGLYYFEEEASGFDEVSLIVAPIDRLNIGADTDNNNWAVFAEGTLDLSDRLRVLGGIRFTDESKTTDLTSVGLDAPIQNLSGPAAGDIEQDFSEVTWRGSAIYELTDSISTYFTASRGFKSGGVFQRVTGAVDNIEDLTFDPEFVDLFELGVKGEFPEQGLRVSVAGFISDYTDIQLDGAPPGSFATIQFNSGDANINGIEAEFDWAPTDNILLNGALGLIDAEYTNLAEGSLVTEDDDLIRTPEVTWSLNGTYEFDLGKVGSLTPGFNWVYNSETAFEATNTDLTTEDGFHAFDLSLRYDNPDENLNLTFGIDNVTDQEYLVAADFNGVIGYELGVFARQRNFFVALGYDF